tara:strand:+ start:177 stop:584 length:408 start_codon:yes stop_codon:yes gene_type:complete
MNYENMFNALAMLNSDYRVPISTLVAETGVTQDELLHIVEKTGCRHYRILGMLPPSELLTYDDHYHFGDVGEFYEFLEDCGLGEAVIDSEGRKGFAPIADIKDRYCLHVPTWGPNWYAWDPAVIDFACDYSQENA